MFAIKARQLACGLSLVVMLAAGCAGSGAPDAHKVTGKLTVDGTAVPNVSVNFVPEEGLPATGTTDAEGKYTLSMHNGAEGAAAGTYILVLGAGPGASGAPAAHATSGGPPKQGALPFPEKYLTKEGSDKSYEVKSGDNEINIELTSK